MKPIAEIIAAKGVKVVDFGDDGCALVVRHAGKTLRVLASWGLGWDHVSVSKIAGTPSWQEMEYVKRLCFLPTETAMQLHVPVSDHVSIKHNCLHIWRPHDGTIPLPPKIMV